MNTPIPSTRASHLKLFSALALAGLTISAVQAQPPAAVEAPVPPQVAMARPTAAEVAKVNEAIDKLLAQQDAATTAIFDKYPQFRIASAPVNTAIIPNYTLGMNRHTDFLQIAQKGDIDLLFMGDSITDFWRNAAKPNDPNQDNPAQAGKAVFDKYFGNLKVANFGVSGDTTQGVLWRLQNGEGKGFSPKAIMLMIGTNNASNGRNTGPEIAEGVGAIVMEMRKDFPDARILLLAIFPRAAPDSPERKTNAAANAIIAKLDDHEHVFFYDIGPKFLDANGIIQPDIMAEPVPLHPTQKGYVIWAEAVKDPIANMLNGQPPFAAAK